MKSEKSLLAAFHLKQWRTGDVNSGTTERKALDEKLEYQI